MFYFTVRFDDNVEGSLHCL